jgi:hypothetical protein
MSESPETPTGVVVDEPMGRALLYAATAEGLLDNDPTIGDGFVGRLMSHRPSSFLPNYDGKGEIFEQQLIDSAPYPHRLGWDAAGLSLTVRDRTRLELDGPLGSARHLKPQLICL